MDVPRLFRALADFTSEDPDDLHFRAGQVISVSDMGESPESWWYGELDGKQGSFPGTYVKPLASFNVVVKTFTAVRGTTREPRRSLPPSPTSRRLPCRALPRALAGLTGPSSCRRRCSPKTKTPASQRKVQGGQAAPCSAASPSILNWTLRLGLPALEQEVLKPNRHVAFDLSIVQIHETYHPSDYDRQVQPRGLTHTHTHTHTHKPGAPQRVIQIACLLFLLLPGNRGSSSQSARTLNGRMKRCGLVRELVQAGPSPSLTASNSRHLYSKRSAIGSWRIGGPISRAVSRPVGPCGTMPGQPSANGQRPTILARRHQVRRTAGA
jgi:hypothetical protein